MMIPSLVTGILLPSTFIFALILCKPRDKKKKKDSKKTRHKKGGSCSVRINEPAEKSKQSTKSEPPGPAKPIDTKKSDVETPAHSSSRKPETLPGQIVEAETQASEEHEEPSSTRTATYLNTDSRSNERDGLNPMTPINHKKDNELDDVVDTVAYMGKVPELFGDDNEEWVKEIEVMDTNLEITETRTTDMRSPDPSMNVKINEQKCELWETRRGDAR